MTSHSNETYIKYLEDCVRQYEDYLAQKTFEMRTNIIQPNELIHIKYAQKAYFHLTKQLDYQYRKSKTQKRRNTSNNVDKENTIVDTNTITKPNTGLGISNTGFNPNAPSFTFTTSQSIQDHIPHTLNTNSTNNPEHMVSSTTAVPFTFPDCYLYKLFGPARCNHGVACPGFWNAQNCEQ